jgi:anti-anti-sigma factor
MFECGDLRERADNVRSPLVLIQQDDVRPEPQGLVVPKDQSHQDDPEWVIFDARIERGPQDLVVVVRGEIDLASVETFSAVVDNALLETSRLVIDFSATTFLDSTGLSVLVAAHRRLGQEREAIVLRSPSDFVRRALLVSGVEDLVTIEDTSGSDS